MCKGNRSMCSGMNGGVPGKQGEEGKEMLLERQVGPNLEGSTFFTTIKDSQINLRDVRKKANNLAQHVSGCLKGHTSSCLFGRVLVPLIHFHFSYCYNNGNTKIIWAGHSRYMLFNFSFH